MVLAAGAVSESLYLGEEAEALVGDDLKNAPEVVRSARGMAPARPIIEGGREIGAMIDEGGRELQRACLLA
ncbi:MAG: hypothetical protein R3D84_13235 [Paracoccaceae bacterium]